MQKGLVTGIVFGVAAIFAVPAIAEAPVSTAVFKCTDGKFIGARFFADKVDLELSDGRSMELPQVISGSGARYANQDESFVFWNKGNTAFVTEGSDETMTYEGCIAGE